MTDKSQSERKSYAWLKLFKLRPTPLAFKAPQSRYFNRDWYLAAYEDVREAGTDPWEHFLAHGEREGRQPGPYFDTSHYKSRRLDVLQGGSSLLSNYENEGAFAGETPNVYFDPAWYASQLTEELGKVDLFLHYLDKGWRSGISPSPYFDIKWYLKVNIDVAAADIEPLQHYIDFGHREGRKPNPYFDLQYYLSTNEDVARSGIEPLKHYILSGWREHGRQPDAYFNKEWYRSTHMNRSEDGQDALYHYLVHGSVKNLNTSPEFDQKFYLLQSPEISDKENAFNHFVTVGREAGRIPNATIPKSVNSTFISWAKANGYRQTVVDQFRRNFSFATNVRTPEQTTRLTLGRLLGDVDAVSFDVFDTLIERSSGIPESVFALLAHEATDFGYMAGNFKERRQEAELAARRRSRHQEVRLSEIYGEFKSITHCPDTVCSSLMAAEIKIEIAVCECKPIGRILFDMAVRAGKTVIFVTDTYLPKHVVKGILENCGYDTSSELFVSSELGATKHFGHLYNYVLARAGILPHRTVHIGDNLHSDGAMARAAGFQTLLVPKMKLGNSLQPKSPTFATQDLWSSLVRAESDLKSERIKFESSSRSENAEFASIGTSVLGPMILDFILVLARNALENGYEKLFFASRDAFYLKEAYDILGRNADFLPKSQYFYASRKVCRFADITSPDHISEIADVDHFPMSVRNFLTSRFMLEEADLLGPDGSTDSTLNHLVRESRSDPILKTILKTYENKIMASANTHRDAYLTYLNAIGLDRVNNAIVDIGYRGTIQKSLANLTGLPIGGFYFMVWPSAQKLLSEGLRYDAFIRREQSQSDVVIRNLQVFELMLSGTHASVSKFYMDNGTPKACLAHPDTTAPTREALNAIRAAALQFIEGMCQRHGRNILNMTPKPELSMLPFGDLLRMPPATLVHALRHHVVEDDFGGETRRLIVGPADEVSYDRALQQSCWQEGTASLWRSMRNDREEAKPHAAVAPIDFFDGYTSYPAFR